MCRPPDAVHLQLCNKDRTESGRMYHTGPIVTISCYYYCRHFDFTFKSGTFGVPGMVLGWGWDAGQRGTNLGRAATLISQWLRTLALLTQLCFPVSC